MEVKDAVNFLRVNLKGIRCTEPHGIANLLESLESENKALKILKQAQKDEDKKEHIRYQTMYRLKRENKKLKKENKAYKGMWKMLSGIANRETDTSFESELFRTIKIIENHYLGGGE